MPVVFLMKFEQAFIMKEKQILPNSEVLGLSLWFPKLKLLAIADLHFGMEGEFQKKGILLPEFNFKETMQGMQEVFEKTGKVEKIVICGDLKHEFGTISQQEWKEVIDFLRLAQKHCKKIILLKGNHDNILGPLANWEGLKVQESFWIEKEKILFLHGDKIPNGEKFKKAKALIIGHEHPAVTLRDGAKVEKFKAFLKGKFKGKNLIVLPSFNSFSEGTDVLKEELLSPFLQQNLEEFEAWVLEGKDSYYFGKLKNLP